MKIIIFSHSSDKYGAELALLEMVNVLKEDNECIVFVPKYGPLVKELKNNGIKVEISKYTWWVYNNKGKISKYKIISVMNLKSTIIKIRYIINIIYSLFTTLKVVKHRPDIILSNSIVINTGIISSSILKVPHIFFIHETIDKDSNLSFDLGKKKSLEIINKKSNYIIVVSKILIEKYSSFIDSDKLKLIYLQNIKKPSKKEATLWPMRSNKNFLKLIMVGNIQDNKNQILAVEVLKLLKDSKIENIQLLIIGNGEKEYMTKLLNKINEYKLNEQILLLGYIDNPYPFIKGSDCLLNLSNFESFGRVIIEGMLCKKIIITSDCSGGPLEIIEDKKTGLFYKKDSVSDLYSKIIYVYENKNIVKKIEDNAEKFSQHFNNPKKYLEELNEVIKKSLVDKKQLK